MTRDDIIAALDGIPARAGVAPDRIGVTPLGGLSNTNLKIETPSGDFVLQMPPLDSEGLRDHAGTVEAVRMATRLGIGAELVHADPANGILLTRWVEGARTMSAGRFRAEPHLVRYAGTLLGHLHRSGERRAHRVDPFDAIRRHVEALGPSPLSPYLTASLARAEAGAEDARLVPIHGDPVPENFIEADSRLVLIDWEFAGMGDPAWDLAYLVLEAELPLEAEASLLAAYGDPGVTPERLSLSKMVAAALTALWGKLRMQRPPSPDLSRWVAARLRQAEELSSVLYPGAGSR